MTTVDGLTLPVRVAIAGDAFDLACDYARTHKLTISEAVSQMLRQVAPLVEDRASLPVSPGDGREGAATATAAPSVSDLERAKALHPSSRPVVEYVKACVYCGERSAHGRCS